MEIIIFLVVGSIILSVIQGAKRGKVTPEERKLKPTLLESVENAVSELADATSKAREESKIKLEHCVWFRRFETSVSAAMKVANERAAHQEKLAAMDAEGRKIFEEIFAKLSAEVGGGEERVPETEPDWLAKGPPSQPDSVSDPELTLIRAQVFQEQVSRHSKFVEMVRGDLRQTPMLRKPFNAAMRDWGLAAILRDHFPAEKADVRFDADETSVPRVSLVAKFDALSSVRNEAQDTGVDFAELGEEMRKAGKSLLRNADTAAQVTNGELGILRKSLEKTRIELASAVEAAPLPASAGSATTDHFAISATQRTADLRALAETLGIPHLVHFTRCENLPSILRHGLRSVADCGAAGIPAIRNDDMRLDGALDGISLSIALPNYRMFYKYRQLPAEADWAVLILSPEILWTKNCGFFKLNAADHRMRDRPREVMTTSHAFREMFETPDVTRDALLRPYDPSDSQAEVMVYEQIEPALIAAIAFETKTSRDRWVHVTGGIETIHAGQGKGMFGTRAQVRTLVTSPDRNKKTMPLHLGQIQINDARVNTNPQIAAANGSLLVALKAKRRELAEAEGVPVYLIFPDRTLIEMSDRWPLDMEQMGRITGIGERKLGAYGQQFLDVIAGKRQ